MKDEVWDNLAKTLGFGSIKEAVQKLYVDAKLSDEKVAERLGCSCPTVRAFRLRFDIPGRKPIPAKATKKDIKGMSCRELAEKYGFSHATAWRLKKRHSLEAPHA